MAFPTLKSSSLTKFVSWSAWALECASESDGDGVDGSMDYVELAENYERLYEN